ncbi:PREDICTED: tyrocidine synthase 3-like [Nicrophorus vespilloides]|uniref:Tyrocidine synthase 3-like n=1 Tax=Nicrophorus vespilloides TaxID=110193 RepID=A0ABM1NI42_NICVS|nr:PREDICTED: tyrocidine synthase 3-like [Nicrophorus vespilloides]
MQYNSKQTKMESISHLSTLKGPIRSLKSETNLCRLFEEVVVGSAEEPALIFEVPRNADGDYIVAICMQPSDKLISVLLAIWKAGAAYLPLDITLPDSRIEHILRESKPALVIYENKDESFGAVFAFSANELFCLSQKYDSENLEDRLTFEKDDLAIVLYTSGSTGVPKGVRLPHNVLLNRLQWQFKAFPYSRTEQVGIFKTALTFVDSVSEIWGPLLNGLSILVVKKENTNDPEKMVALLEKYQIERLVLVPTLLRSLLMFLELKKDKNALSNLKIWVCSGETLSVSLAEDFFKYFPENSERKLCNFYGSTEIMGDVSFHVIGSRSQLKHETKVPIGGPVDNTILYLLDRNYRPVTAGDVGELFVSGYNLAAGYVNGRDPEKFIDNPLAIDPMFSRLFRTGDFARIENGCLQYEGRTDSQVKIRGHRVDLSEVEKAVSSIEGVDKCVALCYKPGEMKQALLAFVTTEASMSENQIESMLKEVLISYMVPQVIQLESIPLLVSGKIDKQSLLKGYENTNKDDDSHFEAEIDYSGVTRDKMPAAKVLFETVASVLGRSARSTISINVNFYEIGGNSLNSIFTITCLNEASYYISISDFIAAMDLGEVLDRMHQSKDNTLTKTEPPIFRMEFLHDGMKDDVLNIVSTSFYQKGDLEQWLKPNIYESEYSKLIGKVWAQLVEKNLSFAAISTVTGKVVGVSLNFDAHDEPEWEKTSKLVLIFELFKTIEGSVRNNKLLTGKGNVLHSFLMTTSLSLSSKENVAVMTYMEDQVNIVAKNKKFNGILTTNTSPLTQQMCPSLYGYKEMYDCQVNTYVASDNSKPFALAPDSQRAIAHWKEF